MSAQSAPRESATAFAPATVANVASGFDILGFALSGLGDHVTVTRSRASGVKIESITGIHDSSQIPVSPEKNTATFPLIKMLEDSLPGFGFSVRIEKGIPLGSGMGGSASSAVGAVVAANAVLGGIFPKEKLLDYALEGEALASGSKHADNIAPCLFGGLTLTCPGPNPKPISLPFPKELLCVLIHPEFRLDTKVARAALKSELPLKTHVEQSARLASLVAGFCLSEVRWIGQGLEDVAIEPQRAGLIPGFAQVKKAALDAGVLGCSISGAGPSLFALTNDAEVAVRAHSAMMRAFEEAAQLPSQGWISPVSAQGARAL